MCLSDKYWFSPVISEGKVRWFSSHPGRYHLNQNAFSLPKARFRRRTFHEPNIIRIKADPNYLDRLN